MNEDALKAGLRKVYGDIGNFSDVVWPGQRLRPYQVGPARALVAAISRNRAGIAGPNQLAVVFSRQAGKDEMTAQLLAYLLNCYQQLDLGIVLAAPTDRQATISRDRLVSRLVNKLNAGLVTTREGYIVKLGRAQVRFLSAAPTASVRGETASLLLVANEAQDISPDRWDAVFDPMAASTNAVTLFLGTVWTSTTLLARQMKYLRSLEEQDGQQRVFLADWQEVAKHVPAYGRRVADRIAQFGGNHPFIQTEYFLKELDGDGGLFPPARRALMVGTHDRLQVAAPGKTYCLLVDVAGENEAGLEDEELRALAPKKDSTAVTVVEVTPGLGGLSVHPTYRVVNRYLWTGIKHTELYGRLAALARDTWRCKFLVIDATGVGAPVASFLGAALGSRVIPFTFSSVSKSELGWNFCGVIDSGRFLSFSGDQEDDTDKWFWRQLAATEYEVRPGPGQLMKWGVKDPALHDDLVISAALVAVLDGQDWRERKAVGIAERWGY